MRRLARIVFNASNLIAISLLLVCVLTQKHPVGIGYKDTRTVSLVDSTTKLPYFYYINIGRAEVTLCAWHDLPYHTHVQNRYDAAQHLLKLLRSNLRDEKPNKEIKDAIQRVQQRLDAIEISGLLESRPDGLRIGQNVFQAPIPPTATRSTFLNIALDRFSEPQNAIHFRRPAIPFYFILAALSIFPLYQFLLACRSRLRRKFGQCPTCGYDLRASSDKCPECGAPRQPTVTS